MPEVLRKPQLTEVTGYADIMTQVRISKGTNTIRIEGYFPNATSLPVSLAATYTGWFTPIATPNPSTALSTSLVVPVITGKLVTGAADTQTFTADGSTTEFTITHNLGYTPTVNIATQSGSASAGVIYHKVSTDMISVFGCTVAPPSGPFKLSYDIR
jgi:hypothetical protein